MSKNSPMLSSTASPVVPTASEHAARRAARGSMSVVAEAVRAYAHFALLVLVVGLISSVFTAGAGGTAHDASYQQQHSGYSQIALAGFAKSITAASENLSGVQRRTPPDFDADIEAAEAEQENEDWNLNGVVSSAPSTTLPEFSSTTDDQFRRDSFVFLTRVGDLRELPRGPPSLS